MSWMLSIVGVAFLGILFDLIYPNGRINALCKSIFGLIAVFVMISPILHINIEDFLIDNASNSELLTNINNSKNDALKAKIENGLKSCGFDNVNVEIESNLNYDEFVVDYIYIDTTNIVLNKELSNINKYEVIKEEVNKLTNLDVERIIVYG